MSLEDFKNSDASELPIAKLIAMISRGHSIYLNHKLEKFDINASQLQFLFEISHQNNINQEKIAFRCNINKGAVARSIKKLEDKGLVKREIDAQNRRQNKISLTDNGKVTLDGGIEIFEQWEREVFGIYDDEKIKSLQMALKEIAIRTIEINQDL